MVLFGYRDSKQEGVGLENYLCRLESRAWRQYARSKVASGLRWRMDLFVEEGDTVWPEDVEENVPATLAAELEFMVADLFSFLLPF
jgi:hypothetical protein